MKFTSKTRIRYKPHWDRLLARYRIFKRIMKLRHKYEPVQIYKHLGCSKAYFYGLLEWRWDCSGEMLNRLTELENEKINT